jgi:hypothetical protein
LLRVIAHDLRIRGRIFFRVTSEKHRFNPGSHAAGNRAIDRLPQIITNDANIDPFVLRSGQHTSRGRGPKVDVADKFLADVWWYLLEIVTQNVFWRYKGSDAESVFSRQARLLDFYRRWKIDAELLQTGGVEFVRDLLMDVAQRVGLRAGDSVFSMTSAPSPTEIYSAALVYWKERLEELVHLHRARRENAHPQRQFARCVSLLSNGSYIQK